MNDAVSFQSSGFPFNDKGVVSDLEKEYWRVITPREVSDEQGIEAFMPKARQRGHLTKEEFLVIARWKSTRPNKKYRENLEAEVESATRVAFVAKTDEEAIKALRSANGGLKGVALRTATALLHWMRPEEYPILDFRVLGALGVEALPGSTPQWEDISFYSGIADRIRASAAKLGVNLRTVDRALWTWHKKKGNNGRAKNCH